MANSPAHIWGKQLRLIIGGVIVSLIIIIAAASLGSSDIKPGDTVLIVLHKIFGIPLKQGIAEQSVSIVWLLRLPRVLLAFFAGGCLAVSGAVCQSILRNPLASPYILGVSSGASLGAGLVIVSGISLTFLGGFTLPLAGFACGLFTVFLVAAFSSRVDKSMSNNTIILCGMVFSLFLNALLTALSAIFSDDLRRIMLWQMGSFAMRGWTYVQLLLPFALLGGVGIFCYSREMDILTFGDDQAKAAGVETQLLRKKLLALCAALTGASVALTGVIGFVDLIAPHAARRITGSRHKYLLPMSFILGGSLMVVADLIARTIISPSELPVGAITALIGAPFFAWVFFKRQRLRVAVNVHGTNIPGAKAPCAIPANVPDTVLQVKGLCAGYSSDVISGINFTAKNGECLCVLGPNGCGKSTLLKSIARLINYRGTITLNGVDLAALSRKELAQKAALLGQNDNLFFPYTVRETVSMGRYAWSQGLPHNLLKSLSAEDNAIIDNIISELDIGGIKDRMIDELSGGQLQRVFLARVLAQTPELILLDEPTNHLDLKHQIELMGYLKEWAKNNNKTIIGVFHDLNMARCFADTAILINNGTIAAAGTIEDMLNSSIFQQVYGIDVLGFLRGLKW